MAATKSKLTRILDDLQRAHGKVRSLAPRDPFAIVLWENVAYLVNDKRRAGAFAALERQVGLDAEAIAEAPDETLLSVTQLGGMHPHARVTKLRTIAELSMEHASGDLDGFVDSGSTTPKDIRKVLKKFPGIGEPGADKILLFAGVEAVVALESNGLRTLLRLGYGQEAKSYSTSYRSAQKAADAELPSKPPPRIRAFELLRRHGQDVCKHSRPLCEECPVADDCPSCR